MATPRELVRCVSASLNVPEGTVVQHDRNLADAGYRTAAKRGRASGTIGYWDATNLIIATAASRNIKDSANTVAIYEHLPNTRIFGNCKLDGLEGSNFAEFFAYLLEDVVNGYKWSNFTINLFGPSDIYAHVEFSTGNRVLFGNPHTGKSCLRYTSTVDRSCLWPIAQLIAA